MALDCDAKTLSMFQRLTKDDLNASTAILKPNAPGSTNLCLSWIWHNAHKMPWPVLMPMPVDSGNVKYISWPLVLITLTLL